MYSDIFLAYSCVFRGIHVYSEEYCFLLYFWCIPVYSRLFLGFWRRHMYSAVFRVYFQNIYFPVYSMCILCVFCVFEEYTQNIPEIHQHFQRVHFFVYSWCILLCKDNVFRCIPSCIPLLELLGLLLLWQLLMLQCRPHTRPKAAFVALLSAHAPAQMAYIKHA